MRPPAFWAAGLDPKSREAAPLTRLLLTPAAALYGFGVSQRIARTTPQKVAAKVICVGNLTTGGAGKTPVARALRDRLVEQTGLRVATLSRGYGGTLRAPTKVDPMGYTAADVGDEPLMLAQSGEAWIGHDKAETAGAMVEDGVQLIVLDDGHQNPCLTKDLSLVVIDAEAPFGNGHVLPKGPLREPIAAGIARADGVVLVGEGRVPEAVRASGKPVIRAVMMPRAIPPKGTLVAFAGIGRPQKFFDMLTATGGMIGEAVPYNDHHAFTDTDLEYLRALASDHGGPLMTTEKDYVRLTGAQKDGVIPFPVDISFRDETVLDELVAPLLPVEA